MKKVYLYGTGSGARKFCAQIKKSSTIDILGFVDSDKNKSGTIFENKKVIHYSELNEDYDYIFICSEYKDIFFNLKRIGVEDEKIICIYEELYIDILENEERKRSILDEEILSYRNLNIVTRAMQETGEDEYYKKIKLYRDYARLKTLELITRELKNNNIQGNIAEVGVYRGDFAKEMNSLLPEKVLYLFDTFEGFSKEDIFYEVKKKYTEERFFEYEDFKNTSEAFVLNRMEYREKCKVFKGYFPETAKGIEDEFCLVSIDVDLYLPIYNALEYFYPRVTEGGYILIHDYNNNEFLGVKEAIKDYEKKYDFKIKKVPISDQGGTIVIVK